jgi:membrane protease subunit HflK
MAPALRRANAPGAPPVAPWQAIRHTAQLAEEQPDPMPWNSGGPSGGSPWGDPPGTPGGPRHGGRPDGGRGNSGRNDSGRGGGPWGGGGRGPGGAPPEIDELIERLQALARGLMPPRFGGGRGRFGRRSGGAAFALLVAGLVAIWLLSGFYRVQPDEQGVVLRFGAFVRTALPGLNYHLPWPIETVLRPQVTRINRVEIGYRSGTSSDEQAPEERQVVARDVPQESLMLTGDENIVDINFAVFWHIRDAAAFLFNTRHPEVTVKSAAESVMREVIGRTPIQFALTEGRAQIETAVMKGVQYILDQYGTGVEITQVQLQKVDPPAAVIDSFRDVQRANTDADRARNEAEAYRNDIVPRARGDAARITAAAEAQRQATIAEATGQTQRFLSVLKSYEAAKDVTLQRLYIETMQDVLSHTPSVVVDPKLQGVLPLLPLGEPPGAHPAPPPAGAAPSPGQPR